MMSQNPQSSNPPKEIGYIAAGRSAFQLRSHQRKLHDEIEKRSPNLAKIYLGALFAIKYTENADHLPQAAHSVREFMEKFPEIANIKTKQNPSLKNKVLELHQSFVRTSKSKCKNNNVWKGEIDDPVSKFLKKSSEFFDWFSSSHETRREEATKTLSKIRKSNPPPNILAYKEAETWLEIRDYFIAVSHHKTNNLDEFDNYLNYLENFVLDKLFPQTFDNFDVIDALLSGDQND